MNKWITSMAYVPWDCQAMARVEVTNGRLGPKASENDVDISLIICSRDRCQPLACCLQSIARIKFERSWELIIVDNGSTDKTAAIVGEFSSKSSFPVAYVFEPTPGLGNARNAALRVARGEVLAFTDDDCYPEHNFLERIWVAFADPFVGYIGGRIILHDPTDYPATINESTTPRIFLARSFVPADAIQGANMAFRRKLLLDLGGFDPLFGAGAPFEAAEDLDAVGRASTKGSNGLYCPEVVVRHHHRRKATDVPRLARAYAIGRGGWYMKLLLHERQFLWFAQNILGFPRRFRWEPRALWEVVGVAKYAYLYLMEIFHSRA